MKIKKGFKLAELAGGFVVMSENPDPNGKNTVISLNKTSEFLWRILEKGADADTLVSELVKAYDVDKERAEKDVEKFIKACQSADVFE